MDIMSSSTVHHGQNVKRLRDILGVKQEEIDCKTIFNPIEKVIEFYERLLNAERERMLCWSR